MNKPVAPPTVEPPKLAFLSGGGEMGERIRDFNWDETPLGTPAQWPQSLKTVVRIMLASRQPIWIGWGEELIYLYNDPYKAIIGGRHPSALGKPTTEVWPEIWDIIGPMLKTAMSGVEGTYVKEQPLIMERHGYREETYYTYSYTPIPDENGHAGGIICANTDDTQRVIGQRQLALLRELSNVMSAAGSAEQVCELAAKIFAASDRDLSFALIYLLDADGKYARLASSSVQLLESVAPKTVSLKDTESYQALNWPFHRALLGETVTIVGLSKRAALPGGAWPEPTETALVLPLTKGSGERPVGFLVAGVSPRRPLDEKHRAFFDLLAGNLASAITTGRAYQEERQRAQALAELDRAKTAFFNNISHEFRTPLTLMLGPIEELQKSGMSSDQAEQVDLLQRNSLRLLKMVNTLLEFSRIEAGRVEANYEPTDLAACTIELASVFRSAVEKAGLRFIVDCPPLPEPVYVDREMWEKIVLNLISNALKFTFTGEIKVSLRWCGERVELAVSDTGVGIPASELPKMFQRFFRVRGVRSRTHEGTGIGIALVQELAQLHGGEARVQSEEGRGSTFLVSIQTGHAHLPHDRIQASDKAAHKTLYLGATPFIEEALRWLPDEKGTNARPQLQSGRPAEKSSSSKTPAVDAPYILLADDNADMREYVRRLLAPDFHIDTVPDGQAALERIQDRLPDLILSDVMMPRLDGFALIERLRADERTRAIPVILLSARAGEEARLEGWDAGADDYLIKPFTARELLARVEAHLRLARFRREAEAKVREINNELSQRIAELQQARRAALNLVEDAEEAHGALSATTAKFQSVFNQSGVLSGILDRNGIVREVSELALTGCGYQLNEVLGQPFWETPLWRGSEEVKRRIRDLAEEAAVGTAVHAVLPYWWADGTERVFDFEMRPVRDENGNVMFLNPAGIDITEHKHAEEAIRHHAQEMETLLNVAPLGVFLVDADLRITQVNPIALPTFGDPGGVIDGNFSDIVHRLWRKETADDLVRHYRHTLKTGESYRDPEFIQPRLDRDNALEYYEWRIDRITLPDGRYGVVCYFRDISAQVHSRENLAYANDLLADRAKQLETLVERRTEELQETVQQLETFSYSIVHDMRAPLRSMRSFASILETEYRDQLDENARSYLGRIMSSSSRLDALITDVLTYSRLAMNKAELQPVNLDKLATEIIEQYPQFQEAASCIRIEHPLPPVLGNSALLTQVLSNLVGNALKFVPPNRKPEVTIRGETDHERVRLWVEDNGIGIPLQHRDKLFGLFQRLHRPDEYPGTGVGLAVVKRAVERMGGTVGLESEPGKGSRFWCELQPIRPETNSNGMLTDRD